MLRFSGGLVLIQYNGLFRAAAGAVQPHIGLAGEERPGSFSTCKVVSSACSTGSLQSCSCSTS